MMLRTAFCDVANCTAKCTENSEGEGFPGWGQLHGIVLNGIQNPLLCPTHLAEVANNLDSEVPDNGVD